MKTNHQNKAQPKKGKAETRSRHPIHNGSQSQENEESIRKLPRHIDYKSCPASLCYSARSNIPPDEQLKGSEHNRLMLSFSQL